MDNWDLKDGLPLLLAHYAEVVRRLEANAVFTRRVVPRKDALDMWPRTRSCQATADHFGVAPPSIRDIVRRAVKAAREIAAGR